MLSEEFFGEKLNKPKKKPNEELYDEEYPD
jgi:hypothetical protein